MAVQDFFAIEIVTELLKLLIQTSRKSLSCRTSADSLMTSINEIYPIIQEIKYSGVELPAMRQVQLDRFSELLREGVELCNKVLRSSRWNVYKNLQLARKMEKLDKKVSMFIKGPMQAHLLADVHHLKFESTERFDRLEACAMRLEEKFVGMKIGVGGGWWLEEAVKKAEMEQERKEGSLVDFCSVGMEVGKRKVKDMLIGRDDLGVAGICGIGGCGKTTLANEVCRDDEVRCYYKNRILFLTVSESPDVQQLKTKIWGFLMRNADSVTDGYMPENLMRNDDDFVGKDYMQDKNSQFEWGIGERWLVVLDDVWSLSVLEQLVCKVPGCKTLVVSRFKFPTVLKNAYEVELLSEDEATSLFCYSAFGQKRIPLGVDASLVKQIVGECKGLPLALKVIGASLKDQPEMYWASARKRLSRGEPICESHENKLLDRLAVSVQFLPTKVKECFLDLGSFPEDMNIPLDLLVTMWAEIHDFYGEEAFAIIAELSDKNLITLIKDPRAGDLYSSSYEISVTQHDVLRDLAIHLNNQENINACKRLLMPRRKSELPKEWERNADKPFYAQTVSVHIGEMEEMDWFRMEFPKAEVLILNFSAAEFLLPPFINDMPKLRALIIMNHSTSNAVLKTAFSNFGSLRSLWLEKVSVSQLLESFNPTKILHKLSLVLCKLDDSLDKLPQLFPSLTELTIDYCDDLIKLPSQLCRMQFLSSLSITNCHNLQELPADLGSLKHLQILRLYACPLLKLLPLSLTELPWLRYLDISQCINLKCLPDSIGSLHTLEKIDMRECPQILDVPKSAMSLKSLRIVICDEELLWPWKDLKYDVHVQVADKCFSLDWLIE